LWATASRRPSRLTISSTARATERASAASQATKRPAPPAASTSRATASPSLARRAATHTRQPDAPHASAMPRPTPPLAPVITTTRGEVAPIAAAPALTTSSRNLQRSPAR
jgi:hypothetical protein